MGPGTFSKDNDRGIYRGVVVDSDDPLNLGRVKIRIPTIHGTESEISNEDLPWSYLCSPNASHNAGSYLIPEEGSTVWAAFENGDRSRPVSLGGAYGRGREGSERYKETDETYVDKNGRTVPARHNNIPVEALYSKSARVVYKSAKGHVLVMYDGDGEEALELSDASGQMLMMRAPLKKGMGKRAGRSAKESILSMSVLNLTNSLGQALQFLSTGTKGILNLIDEVKKRGVLFDEDGKIRIVRQKDKGQETEISMDKGKIIIKVPWATVELNNEEKKISVEAVKLEVKSEEMKIQSNKIDLSGDVTMKGNLKVAGRVSGVLNNSGSIQRPDPVVIEEKEMEDWGVTSGL